MQDLKKIETSVLITMIAAYSSYYGRVLTDNESADCKETIKQLQSELENRKKVDLTMIL